MKKTCAARTEPGTEKNVALTKEMVEDAPKLPGVYLMKSTTGKILYVGKAKSLKIRLKNYACAEEDLAPKTVVLVRQVKRVEWILTPTENDALLLECNLIKQHRPQFNVLMKDDKHFPYLCLDLSHPFPRLTVVRKVKEDGRRYFGPYHQVGSIHEIVRLMNKAFQLRDCTDQTLKTVTRPCVNYEMGTCTAPCVEYVDQTGYEKQVAELCDFLSGRSEGLTERLRDLMAHQSEQEDFEQATVTRNRLQSLEHMAAGQHMISTDASLEMDVFAVVKDVNRPLQIALGCVSVRGGKVIGFQCLPYEPPTELDTMEILATYLTQYYQSHLLPSIILLPPGLNTHQLGLLKKCLKEHQSGVVRIRSARTEEEMYQIEFARRNAESYLAEQITEDLEAQAGVAELQRLLHLEKPPHVIECIDIAHHQGSHIVASLVQFMNGRASKAGYRHYHLKTVHQNDDFSSIAEIVNRRLRRAREEDHFPDLLVIDGGLAQLNAAHRVFQDLGIHEIELAAVAKARTESDMRSAEIKKTEERVFRPGRKNPIQLRPGTKAFEIIVQLRDEAHRFANTAYQTQHRKHLRASVLDELKGIGVKRKNLLLTHFSSVPDMLAASPQQWCELLQCAEDQARQWIHLLDELWSTSQLKK